MTIDEKLDELTNSVSKLNSNLNEFKNESIKQFAEINAILTVNTRELELHKEGVIQNRETLKINREENRLAHEAAKLRENNIKKELEEKLQPVTEHMDSLKYGKQWLKWISGIIVSVATIGASIAYILGLF